MIAVGALLLVLSAAIATFLHYLEPNYSLVLNVSDDWDKDSVVLPQVQTGSLIGAQAITHKYLLHRDSYSLEILINPQGHSIPVNFQAQAVRRSDGGRLGLECRWRGPCGNCSSVQQGFPRWQRFFTDPEGIGFLWSPELYCSRSSSTHGDELALEASNIQLIIKVLDESELVGEETLQLRIERNGFRFLIATP